MKAAGRLWLRWQPFRLAAGALRGAAAASLATLSAMLGSHPSRCVATSQLVGRLESSERRRQMSHQAAACKSTLRFGVAISQAAC